MQEFAEKFAAIAAQWNRVERRAKEYEHFQEGANVSAINEMRYAGRRIVDALTILFSDGKPEEIHAALIVAETYLINAEHDVTDGICFVVLRRLDRVIKKYGRDQIAEHYPDFWHVYPLVLDAQKIIQGTREDRQQRKTDYKKLAEEYLPKLNALYSVLINVKALHVQSDNEELASIKTRVATVTRITVTGAIFSILAFILSLFVWAYPNDYWAIFHRIF